MSKDEKPDPPTIEELESKGLAPWKNPGVPENYLDNQVLFGHLKGFFERYIYFTDPRYYDVLTAWTLHTWHIKRWRASGPLLLIGDVSSGKTTVLECLEETAYRGIRGGSMSNATMFRLSHEYTPTLLVDEAQVYSREEWAETQAFLNERYRPGGRVWRMVGEGTGMIPKFFNAYGGTALAQSSDTWEAMRSRAIVLTMEKGLPDNQTLTDQFFEEGAKLRGQLKQSQVQFFHGEPKLSALDQRLAAQSKQALENMGIEEDYFPDPRPYLENIKDGRVREVGLPLLFMAPEGGPRDNIQSYLEDLEQSHNAESQNSYLAQYVQALDQAVINGGKVSAKEVRYRIACLLGQVEIEIRQTINGEQRKEKVNWDGVPKNKTVMDALRTLGFKDTRMNDGSTGVLWDEKLMERKRRRYALKPPSVSSVSSVPKENPPSQTEATEATEASQDPMPNIVKKPYRCFRCQTVSASYQEHLTHKCESEPLIEQPEDRE